MIRQIILFIIRLFKNKKVENKIPREKREKHYSKKLFLTETEKKFYMMFKAILNDQYIIQPQIYLGSIVKRDDRHKYQSELNRTIDFGIFTKDTYELLLLIEINDSSHNQYTRKKRDYTVKQICNEADIKVIRFWTKYSNTYDYVSKMLNEFLNKNFCPNQNDTNNQTLK